MVGSYDSVVFPKNNAATIEGVRLPRSGGCIHTLAHVSEEPHESNRALLFVV